MYNADDTIVALSTPPGVGALAVIRVSGKHTFDILSKIFTHKKIKNPDSHTLLFGKIHDRQTIIDEVVVGIFKGPHSFTKEDTAEISCHGSPYIVQCILQLIVKQGARYAKPGEFTQRAFLNGRFDLTQAEAVADIIASENQASHQAAMNQMRGGLTAKIKQLREKLINFASLIELELDFSEEDLEFADRSQLKEMLLQTMQTITMLASTFEYGNAIKQGVPIAIVGKPNVGKSTLLNTLADDDKSLVSDIPGTTRDVIEDEINIDGIKFRFVDTAGLRHTQDAIEKMGIEKAYKKINEATLVLYVFDASGVEVNMLKADISTLPHDKPIMVLANKVDVLTSENLKTIEEKLKQLGFTYLMMSAKTGVNIPELKRLIVSAISSKSIHVGDVIVTNMRHYECLIHSADALQNVLAGIDQKHTSDILAEDLKDAIHHLGAITGQITNEDILGNIFSKFCIGK